MLAASVLFKPVAPAGGFALSYEAAIAREVVADWITRRGGRLAEAQFVDAASPRWDVPATIGTCAAD
jgi:hypothetical protein